MVRLNFRGSSAIVTGAASGIGESIALQLAELGLHVIVADLQEDKGSAVANQIDGLFVKCDVSSEADGLAAVSAASELGPLRGLVNSAGVGIAVRTIDRNNEPMAQEEFDRVVRINLLGTFNMVRLAAGAMARTTPLNDDGQRGAIVNLASIAAFDGQVGQVAYSASKGGVVGMTLPLARDLSAVGIRVNTVAPGLIDTPMYGEGAAADAFKARLGESALFPKRLGFGDELASMVCELITNPYVNSEVVRVDGGIRMPPK